MWGQCALCSPGHGEGHRLQGLPRTPQRGWGQPLRLAGLLAWLLGLLRLWLSRNLATCTQRQCIFEAMVTLFCRLTTCTPPDCEAAEPKDSMQ